MELEQLRRIEKKWQEKWSEKKIFNAKVEKRKKYFITIPYPYVSGPYHIGHGRAYTNGDVFARYKRLMGYNVLFPMAFHITGTPVLAISQRIKNNDKDYRGLMKQYILLHTKDENKAEEILSGFAEPWNVVTYFSGTMKQDFKSLGMSLDWEREFTTGDKEYNKFIEWQFQKFYKKGYLKKGKYPITYCTNDKNAVGEDDIKDGDTEEVEVIEFTLLKFKIGKEILIAATLRPDTVFGQTNVWIDHTRIYTKIRVGNENWIISKECAEKLLHQREGIRIIGDVIGEEYIGKYVRAPGAEKDIIILPSKEIDPDIGSGIVTSVPSDAPYDYIALKKIKEEREWKEKLEKIKAIPIIKTDEYGEESARVLCEKFGIKDTNEKEKIEEAKKEAYKAGYHTGIMNENCGRYSGMKVEIAKEKIKQELIKKGKADIFYETSRKAVCRCNGKVIAAIMQDQWFLDYKARGWKEKAIECLHKMQIIPEKYRTSFEATFEWLDKRPCARKRGLGTNFPYQKEYIIESLSDSTVYMAFYTIKKIIKEYKLRPEQLTPELFDYIFLGKGKAKNETERDMKKEFEYWYPMDHRHTAVMHVSNHLSFSIYHHAGIFKKKHWPKKFTLIEPVISEGSKMSKSKGNVVPLAEISRKYSADLFRLYITTNAGFETTADWREKEVQTVGAQILSFYDLITTNIPGNIERGKISATTKAVKSMFYSKMEQAREELENHNQRRYATITFYEMKNIFEQLLKETDNKEKNVILTDLIKDWAVSFSPVMPHIAEDVWEKTKGKGFVSQAKWPATRKHVNKEIEKIWIITNKISDDVKEIIKITSKTPKNITIIISPTWKYKFYKELRKILEKKTEFKEVIKSIMENKDYAKKGQEINKIIGGVIKDRNKLPQADMNQKEELKIITGYKRTLEKRFNCNITIKTAEESKEEKKEQAIPTKPAIILN